MLGIVLEAPHRLVRRDVAAPARPAPGQALVRVLRVGVCGTDLHAYRGAQPMMAYPVVLGHELAVEVLEVGEPLVPGGPAPGGQAPDGQGQGGQAHGGPARPTPAGPAHPAAVAGMGRAPDDRAGHPAAGDICTVIPYLHDGTCGACRRGLSNCCESLSVLGVHEDGGLRERMLVPTASLLPAPGIATEAVALVEMLAIGAHATRRAELTRDDDVLVLGAGPIGLSALAFARGRARRVLAVDLAPRRLELVERLGLAGVVRPPGGGAEAGDARAGAPGDARSGGPGNAAAGRPGDAPAGGPGGAAADDPRRATAGAAGATARTGHDLAAALRELLGGELPTVVMDATGSAASMARAPSLAAHGGRVVLIGHTKGSLSFDNPTLHTRELTLRSSRNATRADFDAVLAALRSGDVDPLPWITTRVDPDALVRDLPAWSRGEGDVVKAVVEMA